MKTEIIDPENQTDHEIGLEIIRLLYLRRKKESGFIETTHGNKSPCGLARTIWGIIDPEHEKKAQVCDALVEALERAIPLLEGSFNQDERRAFAKEIKEYLTLAKGGEQ